MKYKVIIDSSLRIFETEVNEFLSVGWKLYGNFNVNVDELGQLIYSQALIKE